MDIAGKKATPICRSMKCKGRYIGYRSLLNDSHLALKVNKTVYVDPFKQDYRYHN